MIIFCLIFLENGPFKIKELWHVKEEIKYTVISNYENWRTLPVRINGSVPNPSSEGNTLKDVHHLPRRKYSLEKQANDQGSMRRDNKGINTDEPGNKSGKIYINTS